MAAATEYMAIRPSKQIGEEMEPTNRRPDPKTAVAGSIPTTRPKAATISRFKIDALFGLYTYEIPSANVGLSRTPILYGENGLGKTNILRILFHLLSPAGDRGHRTSLGKIKFRRVDVFLSNAIVVSAIRTGEKIDGAIRLQVERQVDASRELLGAWDWYPKDDPSREVSQRLLAHLDPAALRMITKKTSSKERTKAIQSFLVQRIEKESNPLESEEAFLRALRENVPPIYFMTSDRTLSSDQVASDVTLSREYDARAMRPEVMVTIGRERALVEAISMASRHLSQLGLQATRQGSRSMHSIYQDLIKRLASRASSKARKSSQSIASLTKRLLDLSSRYEMYAKYGIAPQLHGEALVKLLADVRPSERSVAGEVLRPYVESLTEQANSFAQAHAVINTLISTVNEFLYDKSLEFSVGEGMLVRNRLGDVLEPRDLSSGEQQLLLLFCHITMAHDSGGIFIIDEPEISLNIKWQRRLVDALLHLDPAENLQFVLASHSMEILTRHRDSVVQLREAVNE